MQTLTSRVSAAETQVAAAKARSQQADTALTSLTNEVGRLRRRVTTAALHLDVARKVGLELGSITLAWLFWVRHPEGWGPLGQ